MLNRQGKERVRRREERIEGEGKRERVSQERERDGITKGEGRREWVSE